MQVEEKQDYISIKKFENNFTYIRLWEDVQKLASEDFF